MAPDRFSGENPRGEGSRDQKQRLALFQDPALSLPIIRMLAELTDEQVDLPKRLTAIAILAMLRNSNVNKRGE